MTTTSNLIAPEKDDGRNNVDYKSNIATFATFHSTIDNVTASDVSVPHYHHTSSTGTSSSHTGSTRKPFSFLNEMYLLSKLVLPSIIIQWNLFIIFPYTAMMIGTASSTTSDVDDTGTPLSSTSTTINLAAFSLGSLLGNLTCLSILEGTLSVADTLLPRAFKSNSIAMNQHDRETMIHITLRTMIIAILLLLLPIVPLYYYSETILVHVLHQNHIASYFASKWIRIYFLGIVPNLFFRICMRFGIAQKFTSPYVVSTTISCIALHPIFVHYFVTTNNDSEKHVEGSALALITTQWTIAIALLIYFYFFPLQYTSSIVTSSSTTPSAPEPVVVLSTWYFGDIVSYKNLFYVLLVDVSTLCDYLLLAMGGIGSMMEWWFFEIICFIVGTFGIIPLCIHTIAYNLVPIVFMIPLGILGGLTVRMGHIIEQQIQHAQLLALYCMICTITWGVFVTSVIYVFRITIIRCFTNDPDVIHGALQIWSNLCYYLLLLHVFAISQAILRSLGKQWYLAIVITFCLYGMTLPTVLYFSVIKDGQIQAVWKILPVCHAILQITLIVVYTTMDWSKAVHKESKKIPAGTIINDCEERIANEQTSLLHVPIFIPQETSQLP